MYFKDLLVELRKIFIIIIYSYKRGVQRVCTKWKTDKKLDCVTEAIILY